MSDEALPCAHVFVLARRVGRDRWRCTKCGFRTRHYDAVDAQAGRPVHRHMSVAVRGFNAQGKGWPL